MTERLYLLDPYLTEFEASIVERRTTDEGPAVVFERTYFYPESGGQPHDLGTIGGVAVTGVFEVDGVILHFVERFPDADRVQCRIDWDRRRDHMQQHSGQHILSAAFVREAGAQTTSFHLGASISTIDLDKPDLSEEDVARAERSANEAVRRALPIASRFVDARETSSLDLRKAPPPAESLRIVEVEGFDRQACCGTHPRTTAEVGSIVTRSSERFKQGTRVEFLCGERALRDYRASVGRVRSLASVLSSSEADLVSTAEKREEDRKTMGKELERLRGELVLYRAESWMSEASSLGPNLVLAKALDASPSELRAAANELTKKPGRIVLLGSVFEGRAHLVFAASESVPADMGALLKACVGEVEGKGGGSARIAQGGGPRMEGLKAALDRAVSQLPAGTCNQATMPDQLSLFAPSENPAPVGPAQVTQEISAIASRLDGRLYLGTSSWAFPGWNGIVYDREASPTTLSRHGLRAYSRNPLLHAVAIDRTYYGPISASEFRAYADQVPESFRFLVKAHEALTKPGEHYLEPGYARDEVIGPALEGLGKKAGVLLFQFPPRSLRNPGVSPRFAEELDSFLRELPREVVYAVELRNPEHFSRTYLGALEASSACHCYNVHPSMPDIAEQTELTFGARFPAIVVRWMLRRDRGYEEARDDFRPFDRLAAEDSSSRATIARLCREAAKPAFVIVNNKAEGSAPLSVFKLAEEISRYQAMP